MLNDEHGVDMMLLHDVQQHRFQPQHVLLCELTDLTLTLACTPDMVHTRYLYDTVLSLDSCRFPPYLRYTSSHAHAQHNVDEGACCTHHFRELYARQLSLTVTDVAVRVSDYPLPLLRAERVELMLSFR